MSAPAKSLATASDFGWFEFAGQTVASLLGVLGALFVYWLSRRHTRAQAAEDISLQAAGDLLTAVAAFNEDWSRPTYFPGGSQGGDVTWLDLRLAVAILAPRLTDPQVRSDVLSVYLRHQELAERSYPEGVAKEEREADWKQKHDAVSRALNRAEATLRDYLFKAAFDQA